MYQESPDLPTGSMVCYKDSQDSERLLYLWLRLITRKAQCLKSAMQKHIAKVQQKPDELHLNDVSWTVLNSPSMCDHRYKVLLTRVHYTSLGVNGNVGRENPHDLDDSVSSHGPIPRAK